MSYLESLYTHWYLSYSLLTLLFGIITIVLFMFYTTDAKRYYSISNSTKEDLYQIVTVFLVLLIVYIIFPDPRVLFPD